MRVWRVALHRYGDNCNAPAFCVILPRASIHAEDSAEQLPKRQPNHAAPAGWSVSTAYPDDDRARRARFPSGSHLLILLTDDGATEQC